MAKSPNPSPEPNPPAAGIVPPSPPPAAVPPAPEPTNPDRMFRVAHTYYGGFPQGRIINEHDIREMYPTITQRDIERAVTDGAIVVTGEPPPAAQEPVPLGPESSPEAIEQRRQQAAETQARAQSAGGQTPVLGGGAAESIAPTPGGAGPATATRQVPNPPVGGTGMSAAR